VLLSGDFLTEETGDLETYLSVCDEEEVIKKIRKYASTGRPLVEGQFIYKLERLTGRALKKRKLGPKK
jgi:hypothetical protein